MKHLTIIFLFLIILPFVVIAQTNSCTIKIHGYSRSILGGAAPTDEIEMGSNVVKSGANNSNKEYYIYLTSCYTTSVTITSVWINGNGYSAKAVKSKSPVVLTNTSLSTKGIRETLVPKTSSPVWELRLSPDDTMLKPSSTIQRTINSNAVVIMGIAKGKKFTSTLKALKGLQPVAMQ
jgi:hypothetical protein